MDSVAEPGFANETLSARVAAAVAAVEALTAVLAQPRQAADVLLAEHRLEHLHRLVGAAQIDNVVAIDTGRLHRIDGHRSVKAHISHVLKVSPEEAARRAKLARALRELPDIATAYRAGRLSLCHVQVLARVHANPRIKDQVPARQEKFLRWAAEETFDGFRDKVLDWESETHRRPTPSRRLHPDMQRRRRRHTDPRTQRGQWCDPDTYRCSTLDGVPLEPVEQFMSSLANHVRRVIVTTKGVVIDLGRKARLFTGSARLAAQLQSPRCIWPGCDVPTSRCEIDHLHDHTKGGPTNPDNGAPLCGFHNRWKQKASPPPETRSPAGGAPTTPTEA